jgi:hypothetical protein
MNVPPPHRKDATSLFRPGLKPHAESCSPLRARACGRDTTNLLSGPSIGQFQSAKRAIETCWGGRRDSNPQHPEPQSGALPLSYDHHSDGTMKLAQDRVPPSGFSPKRPGYTGSTYPAGGAVEKRCNHVPITYGPSLIWKREQLSESPCWASPLEVRCGRTR